MTDSEMVAKAFAKLRKQGIWARMNLPSCGLGCCVDSSVHNSPKYKALVAQYGTEEFPALFFTRVRGLKEANIASDDYLCINWSAVDVPAMVEVLKAEGLNAFWSGNPHHSILVFPQGAEIPECHKEKVVVQV